MRDGWCEETRCQTCRGRPGDCPLSGLCRLGRQNGHPKSLSRDPRPGCRGTGDGRSEPGQRRGMVARPDRWPAHPRTGNGGKTSCRCAIGQSPDPI